MLWSLLIIPLAAGLICILIRSDSFRRAVLVAAAAAHSSVLAASWFVSPEPILSGWVALDPTGQIFLSITSALFLAAAVYAAGYLKHEPQHVKRFEDVSIFVNAPQAVFTGRLVTFLFAI